MNRIQDDRFHRADKPPKCSNSRIECDIYRFKASQFKLDGKVDNGDGDTIFTQILKGMKSKEPSKYMEWFRREGTDDRVFRANFKGESSIDAGGPYREVMENISQEVCSSVLPMLSPTENQRHEHGFLRECFILNHQATSKANLEQIMQLGLIIGFAIRSMQTWNMSLHPIVWKEIVGA